MFLEKFNKNHWPSIGNFFMGILSGFGLVCRLICSRTSRAEIRQRLTNNHFFKSLHYAIFGAPKIFWKKPSGIEIGRLPLKIWLYAFGRDAYFDSNSGRSASITSEIPPIPVGQTQSKRGFTLVEMLVSLTLIGIVLITAFAALANIGVLKNRVVGRVNLYEELYTATENIGDLIKSSGGIDYEEYFNRRILGTSLSGSHYAVLSGFGNYGDGGSIGSSSYGNAPYLCRSRTTTSDRIIGNGCYATGALNSGNSVQTGIAGAPGKQQRYGQYALQFTDYNKFGAATCETTLPGDQDCNGNIVGDDDDEDLGSGPTAMSGGVAVELYLIRKSQTTPERRIFRLLTERDPYAPAAGSPGGQGECDTLTGTGPACRGRLQMLKLVGKDLGINHIGTGSGAYDGKIDTWECASDYSCSTTGLSTVGNKFIPANIDSEWVDVLSSDLSVESLQFYPNPITDSNLNWRDPGTALQNQSVRYNITVGYSWKRNRLLGKIGPKVSVSTSVNLNP
jgi:prepilin-type N-terminal cleavage/methylation domain-containing protein